MTARVAVAWLAIIGAWAPGETPRTPQKEVNLHVDYVLGSERYQVFASAEGLVLVTTPKESADHWEFSTAPITSVRMSRDGRKLLGAHKDGTVELWDMERKGSVWKESVTATDEIESAHWLEDDAVAVVQAVDKGAGKRGRVYVLDPTGKHKKRTVEFANEFIVSSLAVDKKRLAVTYEASPSGNRVAVLDVAAGKVTVEGKCREGTNLLAAASEGRELVCSAADADHMVLIIDVKTAKEVATVRVHEQFVSQAALTRGAKYLLVAGKSGRLEVIDYPARKYVGQSTLEDVCTFGVSEDGQTVVVAHGNNSNRQATKEVRTYPIADIVKGAEKK